jgi:branched-chain amino acid transport system permease protein
MLVLGGLGTLYGALVGTVIFMGFEHIVSAINPFHWMMMVGALLVAVVLAAPGGLSGVLDQIFGSGKRKKGGRA